MQKIFKLQHIADESMLCPLHKFFFINLSDKYALFGRILPIGNDRLTNCCSFLNSFGFVPGGTNCKGFSMRTAVECVGEPSATHFSGEQINPIDLIVFVQKKVNRSKRPFYRKETNR